MSNFFDTFPRIAYDIDGKRLTNYRVVTNIFFRVRVLREVLNNISAYYEHLIMDGDTPEILAEKVYGNSEAHWIILIANDIVDPQYDWPLGYNAFQKYIINKYGSVENAKTTYHHYEKVIKREESKSGVISEFRYVVNSSNVASEMSISVPYDHYGNLADVQDVDATNNIEIGTGTVIEVTYRDRITNYDYEVEINESKRNIKIIKPEYYQQIVRELDNLTQNTRNIPYIRGFR
jgi:hypothetical protein